MKKNQNSTAIWRPVELTHSKESQGSSAATWLLDEEMNALKFKDGQRKKKRNQWRIGTFSPFSPVKRHQRPSGCLPYFIFLLAEIRKVPYRLPPSAIYIRYAVWTKELSTQSRRHSINSQQESYKYNRSQNVFRCRLSSCIASPSLFLYYIYRIYPFKLLAHYIERSIK